VSSDPSSEGILVCVLPKKLLGLGVDARPWGAPMAHGRCWGRVVWLLESRLGWPPCLYLRVLLGLVWFVRATSLVSLRL